MKIGKAIKALKKGLPIRRKEWSAEYFIFKQVESLVGKDIIPKMTSLTEEVKTILDNKNSNLYYQFQITLVNTATRPVKMESFSFAIEDILQDDWEIYEEKK